MRRTASATARMPPSGLQASAVMGPLWLSSFTRLSVPPLTLYTRALLSCKRPHDSIRPLSSSFAHVAAHSEERPLGMEPDGSGLEVDGEGAEEGALLEEADLLLAGDGGEGAGRNADAPRLAPERLAVGLRPCPWHSTSVGSRNWG